MSNLEKGEFAEPSRLDTHLFFAFLLADEATEEE
jgi:hypothetical protein